MTVNMTRRALIAAALASAGFRASAEARAYDLVTDTSRIKFTFTTSAGPQTGTVPVDTAQILIDPRQLANSQATVTADIREVTAGLPFVTEAIKSADLLDAQNHPVVRFRSTKIRLGSKGRISEGAQIEGDLTLRGVTLPITLDAILSRPTGSAPDDLSILYVQLNGSLDRQHYGASGFPGLAENRVELDIFTELTARD